MRKLLLLISWCVFTVSCSTQQNFSKIENSSTHSSCIPVFGTDATDAIFRGTIDVNGKYFSGIFVFKELADNKFRAVLMSEVGMTLLDMTFTHKDFHVNYCIEPLSKKGLFKLLYHDFKLALDEPGPQQLNRKKNLDIDSKTMVYKKKDSRDFYYFADGTVIKILSKTLYNKTEIQFKGLNDGKADAIHIQHRPVKLRIELTRIN
jgi:hypothetical protein